MTAKSRDWIVEYEVRGAGMTLASRRTTGRWCRVPNWSLCSTMQLECSPDSRLGKRNMFKLMRIQPEGFRKIRCLIQTIHLDRVK